jgi:hypothetical protein
MPYHEVILDDIGWNIRALDVYLNELQPNFTLPILIKKYLKMNGRVLGFNIDKDFNNCLDALMIARIADIPEEMISSLTKEIQENSLRERFKNVLN